jgi:hypothetical protein
LRRNRRESGLRRAFGRSFVLFIAQLVAFGTFSVTNAVASTLITRNISDEGQATLAAGDVRVHVSTTGVTADPLQSEVSIFVQKDLVFDRKLSLATLSVSLVPTEHSAEPIVDVQLFSGGAHCCFSDLYIRLANDAADVTSFSNTWGSYPPKYIRLGDEYLLKGWIGTDYDFGNFAGSTGAIILYTIGRDGLHDVTQGYVSALSRDAMQHLSDYNLEARSGRTGDASLACYLADEIRLGNSQQAWSRVRAVYTGPDFDGFASKVRRWLASASIEEH